MANFFLVVKTVTPKNEPFTGAAATFTVNSGPDTSLTSTSERGVLELPHPAGATGGRIQVTASAGESGIKGASYATSQSVNIDLTTSPPTIAFDKVQSIEALRLAVSSRAADFNLGNAETAAPTLATTGNVTGGLLQSWPY